MAEDELYPIHKCVFEGDVKTLGSIVKTHDITAKDKQGIITILLLHLQ